MTDKARVGQSPPSINDLINLNCSDFYPNGPTSPAPDTTPAVVTATTPATTVVSLGPGELTLTSPRPPYSTSTSPIPTVTLVSFSSPPSGVSPAATSTTTTSSTSTTNTSSTTSSMSLRGSVSGTHIPALAVTTTSTSASASATVPDLGTPEHLTQPLAIHGAFLCGHDSVSPRDGKRSTPLTPAGTASGAPLDRAATGGMCPLATPQSARLSMAPPVAATATASPTSSSSASSTASATPAALLALRGAAQRCIPGKGGLLLPLPRPADTSGGSGGSSRDKGSGNGSDDNSNGNNSSSSSGGGEGPAKECEEPNVIVLKLRREEKQRLRDMVLQSEFARCAAGLGDRKALGSAFDAVDDGYLRAFALLFLAHLARITRTVFDLSTPGFFEQRVLAPFVRSILVAIDESPADFPVALSASTAPATAPWTPATPAAAAAAATSAAAMAAAAAAARANGLSSVPLSPVVSSTGATAAAGSPLPLGGGGGAGSSGGGVPRRKLSNFSVNAEDTAPDTPFSGSGSGNYCSNSPGGREPMRVRSNSIASPSYRSASDSVGGASSNVSSVASSSMASPSVGASTSSTSSASTSSAAAAAAAGGGGAPKEKRAKRKGSGVLAPADDDAEAAGTPGQLRGSTYWSTPPTRRASPLQGAAPKSLEIPPLEQSVETTVEGLLVNKSTVAALLLPQLCTTLERSLPDPAMLPAGVASVLWKALELAARAVARGGDLLGAGCDTRYLMTAGRFPYAKPTTPSAGTISTAASSSSSSASLSSSPPTSASSSASSSPANSTVTITTPSTTTTTTTASSGKKSSRRGPLKSTNSTGSINIPITSVTTPKQQAQPQQVQQIQQMQSLPSLASAKHLSPAMPQLQSAANVSNSNVIPNSTNSIINNSNSNVNQPSSLSSSSSSVPPPPQQQQQQQQQQPSSSSSSATLSGGAKCSVCGGEDGLPPVSVRTLHWGNVFRDKSTGMYVYRSNLDKVQIGALADTVKMCVERGAEVPSAYILPARLFACGANWADFEFPVLFHIYVTRRVARGKLVKPTIIGSHAQIARVRQALAEAVATPTRAQLQADAGDDAAALAPEFEYLSEGRVMGLDEYINFREFDEATGVACVPLPLRNCPDRCGYLVIRKRASLLFFYEDGRLTGIVDSDAQHVPNPRAAEFYAQHAIPPPPSSQPTLQSQGTSLQSQGTSIPSAGSITNASDTPHIVVPSLGPPGATPGFVFTPPEFGVTFLGTSHGFDKNGRTSGCIVWLGGRGLAVDPPYGSYAYLAGCAGGAALRMIDGVLLTHCHADHDSGLLQFILGARRRLSLYGVAAVLASERRKLSATLGCADPTAYYRPVPVPVGVPTRIGAGVFVFNYSFHSIPTAAFKVACGGKTLFYSADTKYDPALYADLEARGVLSPERARHLASWGFDADHIIHEMGAPPLHTSVAVLNKLPPQVKARMRVIHCVSVPEFFKHEAIEGIYKPPEGLENTLRFDVSCPPDPLVVVSGPSSKVSAVAAATAAAGAGAGAGAGAAGEAPLSVPRTPQTPLEAEALRLLGTTVPFLRSDPAALAALAPLARKKSYSKGKRVAKTHSGLYIVAAGAVIRRPADPRLSHSPSPNPIDGTAAAAATTTTSNSSGGDGSNSSSSSRSSSSGGGGSSKKKKSSHHHSQTQSKSQSQPQSHHKHPGQGSPTLVANGASGSSAVVLYYGDYFGENAAASASAAAAQPLYTYTAACTPTVIIRVSAKALRKILPQGRLLAPCIHGPTTAAAAPPHCLLRIFEAQCGECTAEALLTQGERSLERALSAASSPLPSNPKGPSNSNSNVNGSGNGNGNGVLNGISNSNADGNLNGCGISNSNSNVDGNLNGYGISNSNVNAILNLSGSGCPWAVCFVRKGSLLVKAAGGESGFRKVAAGGWFAPGKVEAIYVVEETSLCLVDWRSFERVVADAPYLLHYVKSSGVPM